MAERERERAHDSQPVGEVDHSRGVLRHGGRSSRLERQDLDLAARQVAVEGTAVQRRALSGDRSPFLSGAEVVNEPEVDVAHRRS